MAKKFGKLLVFSAVVGSAIGAVCYYVRKKNAEAEGAEDDYDDFGAEEEAKPGDSRSYVPLNPDTQAEEEQEAAKSAPSQEESPEEEKAEESGFTPLAEQVAQTAQKAEETVEEFFDEEDGSDEEPPISDN